MQPIRVRPGKFTDYPQIREYDEFLGDRRLDLQRRELLVADLGESVAVGYVKISVALFLNRPLVDLLAVSPLFRRRGIATALLEAACTTLQGAQVYLTTEESNTAMRALLSGLKWELVGHIDRFNFSGDRELIYRWGEWS